ncbi:cell division protein DamX [Escherichia coli]|uniref:cell division protein DamX n=1 Tax=Escherichia coli TaxID=562 RepID=UPI0018371E5E|nr:cell division protein DamX [Escherichia coli]MCX3356768.1 cell division protein DamX [Escherichia coli]HAH1327979.1 cell division protein DamX [Escherichia coli]
MDEFKPEDELKPDPSDRRTGRSRQSSERSERTERGEPQINFDDIELDDTDDRRPTRAQKERNEEPEIEEEIDESEDETVDEERVERRPRKRKKAASKPASRQYMMMGVGILVLLLLIIGIGSALKAPSTSSSDQTASGEKSIDLAGNATDQANGVQPAPGTTSAENTQQDVSLPPISSTPTQGQTPAATDGQQRVEVQGDLNNALTQPQNQQQLNNVAVNSTLPTEPATVAPVRNGNASRDTAKTQTAERPSTTRPARQQAVIEPKKPQATVKTEPKPVAQTPKRTEPAAPVASTKAPAATSTPAPKETATTAPVQTASPAQTTATPAAGGKTEGNVGSLKSAPSSHYTLQLSSSSNYDNLNGWAKKENLKNYVVYETTRNGQPWYVLVSGVYASKEEAKKAVSTLPADVQAKNPWAKPLRQVQADLK